MVLPAAVSVIKGVTGDVCVIHLCIAENEQHVVRLRIIFEMFTWELAGRLFF